MSTELSLLSKHRKKYWAWVPLVFSCFYFLPLVLNYDKFTVTFIALQIVLFTTFIYLHIRCSRDFNRQTPWLLTSMLLLCIFGTYTTPGTQALFGYIVFFVAFYYPIEKAMFGAIIVISGVFFAAFTFDFVNVFFYCTCIVYLLGIIFYGSSCASR